MTQPEPPPTRREFRALARRVEAMDKYGSRATIAMAAQISGIAHNLADLKRDFEQQQERHERRRHDRIIGRRWIIGTCIAAVVALVAVITLLLQLYGRVR